MRLTSTLLFALLAFISINGQSYSGTCQPLKSSNNCNTITSVVIGESGDIEADWIWGSLSGKAVANSSLLIYSVWVQYGGVGAWTQISNLGETCIGDIKSNNPGGLWKLPGNFNPEDEVIIYYESWTNPRCDGSCCGVNVSTTDGVILPVLFKSFSLESVNPVTLSWETNIEVNNDYFSIQRSNGEESFQEIGKVIGAGNSNTVQTYKFEDPNPLPGLSYYRLEQFDFDGQSSLSEIITFKKEDKPSFIYNQFNQELIVNNVKNSRIGIFSMDGKVSFQGQAGPGETRFELGNLSQGIYIINVFSGKDIVSGKIFIH